MKSLDSSTTQIFTMDGWNREVVILTLFISFIAVLRVVDSSVPGCPKCDNGSCKALNFPSQIASNHYYLHTMLKVNWFQAHQFCLMHGMRLATIENQEQNDELVELIHKNRIYDVWIGVTDLGDDGKFYSMRNGASQRYTNWREGQPDDSFNGEPCVRYLRWGDGSEHWNDDTCSLLSHFACDLAP